MKKAILITALCEVLALALALASNSRANPISTEYLKAAAFATAAEPQNSCPTILTEPVVTVAPNQPEVEPRATVGIINALCDVTLDFVSCGFTPSSIKITCDTNGDGVPELIIPLKNITVVNRLLLQATIPALSPQLPGSPFPLACCGGIANITLSRTITAGDDNVFGDFTQTQTCQIDLGIRAPVVISASPSSGDCAVAQNLVIPGSCYLLADGKPNVTSVFAVERVNPSNVLQSKNFVILNTNLIDALFDFGGANAGKTFLIFASGPNGTSRNLTSLPAGTRTDCPLGNEQGVMVTFSCKGLTGGSSGGSGGTGEAPPASFAPMTSCEIDRDPSGSVKLNLFGHGLKKTATLTIGGVTPKKLQFKDFDSTAGTYSRIVAKGRVCKGLPGTIVYAEPNGGPTQAFFCGAQCQ